MNELETLSQEVIVLVDKLHSDYNKFFSGAEKKPPILQRERLNKLIEKLRQMMRQALTPTASFKAQNAVNKFNTYAALWDKKMLEREKN